jgi:hypothetical protein
MKSLIIEVVTTWFAIFSTKKKYWNISRLDSNYGWFGLSCGMFAILQENEWRLGKIGILQIISWVLKVTWYEWVDLKATNFLDLLSICTSDLVQIWASYSRNKISNRVLLKGFFFCFAFGGLGSTVTSIPKFGQTQERVSYRGNF